MALRGRASALRSMALRGRASPSSLLAPIWASGLLASNLASHQVPGTDLAPGLLASDLASHRVPGTDLGSRFASIRPGVAPGAWHRFRTDLGSRFASIQPGVAPGAWHRFGIPVC